MNAVASRIVLTSLLVVALSTGGVEAKKLLEGVQPGPRVQSAAELALEADPSSGVEHAIVLVEEYERNEDKGAEMETRYHMRAKILSNEGRDLADVEIEDLSRGARLIEWWGRTIQPDGTVVELARDDVERQLTSKSVRGKTEAVKAALPGVVPGSVIDFGYVIRESGYYPFTSVALQRRYRTDEFRYAWRPYRNFASAFYLDRTDELDVTHTKDSKAIVVEGHDLPPVRSERYMPPFDASRAMLYLYYLPSFTSFEKFWDDEARRRTTWIDRSITRKSVKNALELIGPPADGELEAKLRAVYDWIGANIVREGLRSFEERREDDESDDDKERRDIVRQLLDTRSGSRYEIDKFFIALARGLGAEARLVYAVDRTDNYWNPNLRSMSQFAATLVAVGPPGAGADAMSVLDPGCGLPYGQVPWWLAGVRGMLVLDKTVEAIQIPLAGPSGAVVNATASIEFADENELARIEWTKLASGQEGMTELRSLRRVKPSERERRVEDDCSTGGEAEVLAAEVSGVDEVTDQLRLTCEVEDFTDLDESIGTYRYSFRGPWIRGVADLPDETRIHPLVLPYPRFEETVITIAAPESFVPHAAPDAVDLKSPYGRYKLDIVQAADGFQVTRRLAMTLPAIPQDHYGPFREFLEAIRGHDRASVTFKRGSDSAVLGR